MWRLILCLVLATGCAAEERVDALEERLNKLRDEPESAPWSEDIAALQERLAALQASSKESLRAINERLSALHTQPAAATAPPAQEGVTAAPDQPQAAPAPAPTSAAATPGEDIWAAVDSALGVSTDVSESSDGYKIRRSWIRRQLQTLGPIKLTPGKQAGVRIKGVRPKTLLGRLGFRNNDLILAIGNITVSDAQEISTALRQLGASATVTLKRRKKELTLKYTIVD